MQIITQPLPRIDLIGRQPRPPIRQREEEGKPIKHRRQHHPRSNPRAQHTLPPQSLLRSLEVFPRLFGNLGREFIFLGRDAGGDFVVEHGVDVEDEFDEGAGHEAGCQVGGEVVVQEELAAHEVEGEVVGCPAEEEEAGRVV